MSTQSSLILQNHSNLSGEALEDFFKNCPNPLQDGAELNCWNEEYFLKTHMIKSKIPLPTAIMRKNSSLSLMKVFRGDNAVYDKIVVDMRNSILSMRDPSDPNKLLFEEMISALSGGESSNINDQLPASDQPARDYLAPAISISAGQNEIYGLAEDVSQTMAPEAPSESEAAPSTKEIHQFWDTLAEQISKITSQGEMDNACFWAETVLGLISLHCFKLIARKANSVSTSMAKRLHKDFMDIYKPLNWSMHLMPPCQNTLISLEGIFQSGNQQVLELVSILIGKLIIENSKPSSPQSIKGVLLGGCLTHIGLFGLSPVKQIEQLSAAMGRPASEICSLLCTTSTKTSLVNVVELMTLASRKPGRQTILGVDYDLPSQLSWRFCRIYNQNHFNRLSTKTNLRLIIRCAAFLASCVERSEISNMLILKASTNSRLFAYEKGIAQEYFLTKAKEGDEGLTASARQIFQKASIPYPKSRSE